MDKFWKEFKGLNSWIQGLIIFGAFVLLVLIALSPVAGTAVSAFITALWVLIVNKKGSG